MRILTDCLPQLGVVFASIPYYKVGSAGSSIWSIIYGISPAIRGVGILN